APRVVSRLNARFDPQSSTGPCKVPRLNRESCMACVLVEALHLAPPCPRRFGHEQPAPRRASPPRETWKVSSAPARTAPLAGQIEGVASSTLLPAGSRK